MTSLAVSNCSRYSCIRTCNCGSDELPQPFSVYRANERGIPSRLFAIASRVWPHCRRHLDLMASAPSMSILKSGLVPSSGRLRGQLMLCAEYICSSGLGMFQCLGAEWNQVWSMLPDCPLVRAPCLGVPVMQGRVDGGSPAASASPLPPCSPFLLIGRLCPTNFIHLSRDLEAGACHAPLVLLIRLSSAILDKMATVSCVHCSLHLVSKTQFRSSVFAFNESAAAACESSWPRGPASSAKHRGTKPRLIKPLDQRPD